MSNDTFQWTDERVLAFVNFTYRNNANLLLEKDLEAFKQSKMPKKSAMYYHTPPYPEKEWEIVSYMPPSNHPIPATNTLVDLYDFPIHAVRRLSDNEVFTVGDEICELGLYSNKTSKINSIRIINGTIGLGYGDGGEVVIGVAKKQPKKERIEVTAKYGYNNNPYIVEVHSSHVIASDKVICICKAAERVLNDEGDDSKIYTKEDHDILIEAAQSAAFNAAREPYCATAMGQRPKYWTFQDYLNHQRDKK